MPDKLQRCYRMNFLSKVILRADFNTQPLTVTAERPIFSDIAETIFPHASSTPLVEMHVNMTQEGGEVVQRVTGTVWNYRKKADGTAVVSFSNNYVSLEYGPGDYTTFDSFFAEFTTLLNALRQRYNLQLIDRIGLRYINEIRLPGKALEWDGILRPDLVAATVQALPMQKGRMLRSMHQVIQQHGEDVLVFNYGIFNPDYPSPAVQRNFVIDIDCARQGAIPVIEALDCVRTLNDLASDTFESCIEDGLRTTMGVIS